MELLRVANMPLSGPGLASEIQTALTPYNGTQFAPFCTAIGMGIVLATSGMLTFTTADVGTVPGVGAGVGTGITGLVSANIQTQMYNKGQSFWASLQTGGPGTEWMNICTKIALVVKTHFAMNATLTSAHAPVFLGVGTVLSYAGVTIPAMKAAIVAQAPGAWAAARFPELAEAVATGVVLELTTHSPTDTVTITGSPTGIPVPGAGSGAGIVT